MLNAQNIMAWHSKYSENVADEMKTAVGCAEISI
jgi:hypothetical protein